MKILWITDSPRKQLSEILHLNNAQPVSGTWVDNAYEDAKKSEGIFIDFAARSKKVKTGQVLRKEQNGIKGFLVHRKRISFGKPGSKADINAWSRVIDESNPDIIQFFGTESSFSYDVLRALKKPIPIVVFCQGMLGIQCEYKFGGIASDPLLKLSFRERLSLFIPKIKYHFERKQIDLEKVVIKRTGFMISDTNFVEEYYSLINPNLRFLTIPEPINPLFLENTWNIATSNRHTIFTVFGNSLNKGLLKLFEAVDMLKSEYPDIKVICPGPYKLDSNGHIKNRGRHSTFELVASRYISEHHLEKNISFVGQLSPKQMVEQLLHCRCFVNPSAMETQVGSLREALFVGAPTITSLCGSVQEFVTHNKSSIVYRFDEPWSLAGAIKRIFNNDQLACSLGTNGRNEILKFYQAKKEFGTWKELYQSIIEHEGKRSEEK